MADGILSAQAVIRIESGVVGLMRGSRVRSRQLPTKGLRVRLRHHRGCIMLRIIVLSGLRVVLLAAITSHSGGSWRSAALLPYEQLIHLAGSNTVPPV